MKYNTYLYLIKFNNEDEIITKSLKSAYSKFLEYVEKNNIETDLTEAGFMCMYRGQRRIPEFIEKIERLDKVEYLKEELDLRFKYHKNPYNNNNINRVLNRRGIE